MTNDKWEQPELELDLPPAPNDFELKSLVGCAAIFIIGGVHPDIFTKHGTKAAVRAAVVVLNGPDRGTEVIDVMLFNTRVVRRLRQGVVGKPYTLHVDEDTQYTQPAIVLLDPSEEERALGRQWHIDNPGRSADLADAVGTAFEMALEQDRGNNRQMERPSQQQQAQRRTPPPTGPNYGKPDVAKDVAPSGPPSTPKLPIEQDRKFDDEPPF